MTPTEAPPGSRREPIPTWYFALVVVRRGDRFLLVKERKFGQTWFLPAGRVEPGETLVQGAVRETLEEAGLKVRVDGIYRVEHTPAGATARLRVIFAAVPVDDRPPKAVPDAESLGANWFTLEELDSLPLRGDEVQPLLEAVARGAPVYPVSIIQPEGTPLL